MDNLPRYFVLESLINNKYLCCIHDDSVLHGHVEFSRDEAISPYTKYEFEPAMNQEANKGLFNIRCCYNNKYWTRKEETTRWIAATAAEPVEDQFKWSCTLFEPSILPPVSSHGKSMLTLRHVQESHHVPVSIGSADPTYLSCLKADANPTIRCDFSNTMFSIVDWESFVILPKLVAFKGDNGLYLRYNLFLQFDCGDAAVNFVPVEVNYTRDGSVRFSSFGYVWHKTNPGDRIIASENSHTDKADDATDLFWLVKGRGDDEVAIRHKGNDKFCQRAITLTDADPRRNNSLIAIAPSMVKEAILRVEEPDVSRSIYNVDFRFKDARIYNQFVVLIMSKQFSNTLDTDQVTQVSQTFTKDAISTWKSIVSLKLVTPTTIETGIPLILDGKVGVWDEYEGGYEWGTDMKGSQTTEFSNHIVIPANSTVTVHITATKGKCDVPFSYMQRDTLNSGVVTIDKMDDGVYTGVNCYNFETTIVTLS